MIDDWKPRPRPKRLPYGYMVDPENSTICIPDPLIIGHLDEALDQLDSGLTLRAVADTLNAKAGTSLSHSGLKIIWYKNRPNRPVKHWGAIKKSVRMPKAERSTYRKKMKLSSEKKSLAALKKRIAARQEELGLIKKKEEEEVQLLKANLIVTEYETVDIPEGREVAFQASPGPQAMFLAASEQEVLYGGAAGGGKSYALMADPMVYFDNPHFQGLLIRRTTDELRKLIRESHMVYKKYKPDAHWSDKKSCWTFPSGAQIWMSYLDRDDDVMRYIGQDFSWIGIDELTQYSTPYVWNFLSSRLRAPIHSNLPLLKRATTNPGGPGHGWVKKMFIDPAPWGQAFPAQDENGETMFIPMDDLNFPQEMWGKPLFYRRFIPAKLSDNPYLDWRYRANLMGQSDNVKRQLLDGDWTVADGAAFSEFRTAIHTCKPFDIPHSWLRFRSCDYGYSERQASAVHWYAVDPQFGTLYVYRELYVFRHTGPMLGKRILELEANENISYGMLDSSVWSDRGQTGPTTAEAMQTMGLRWRKSDRTPGARIASKHRLHELLRVDEFTGKPGIIFFDNCRQIIADLPVIPMAPASQGDDDIDRRYQNDHAYDSIRYGIQSRPKGQVGWDTWGSQTSTQTRPADTVFGY